MQQAELSPKMLASYTEVQVQVLATLFFIQLSVHVSGKAADNIPNTWTPAMHVGDLDGVLGLGCQLAQF